MNKKKVYVIAIIILIVSISSVLIYYINSKTVVSKIINSESFVSCHFSKGSGESSYVYFDSKNDIKMIFDVFYDKRIRKILPWERHFYTYYHISTNDNNSITIYDAEYIAVVIDYKQVIYKFIDPIDVSVFEDILSQN